MRIIYISPLGVFNPRLFPVLKQEFTTHCEVDNPIDSTHCFIEAISGTVEYGKIILEVIERKIPIICFDNREWGEMKNEKWHPIEGITPNIYFVRNMNKTEQYPDNVFPYDWPFFPECDYPMTTKEELNSRPYDCCLISVESPTRKNVVDGTLKDGRLKLNYKFLDHTQRMPYEQWIAEHRKAKLYINCEGGGMTTERPNQLFSIAGLLQVKNNHVSPNPFTDGINCLEISEHPTPEEIEKVVDIINDKEWLWDIYTNGISWTKEKYSGEAVANYILEKLKDEGIC